MTSSIRRLILPTVKNKKVNVKTQSQAKDVQIAISEQENKPLYEDSYDEVRKDVIFVTQSVCVLALFNFRDSMPML